MKRHAGRLVSDEFSHGEAVMGRVCRVIKSGISIVLWKIRYGDGIRIPIVQNLDRVHLEIYNKGKICIGKRVQNRGDLYLICDRGGDMRIGSHVFFNANCSISCMGKVTIGDYCKMGNNLVIVDHDHNYKNTDSEYLTGEVHIGNRVWIGANCTILKGTSIGDDSVIAAGSVVKGEIPAGTVLTQKRQDVWKTINIK